MLEALCNQFISELANYMTVITKVVSKSVNNNFSETTEDQDVDQALDHKVTSEFCKDMSDFYLNWLLVCDFPS